MGGILLDVFDFVRSYLTRQDTLTHHGNSASANIQAEAKTKKATA